MNISFFATIPEFMSGKKTMTSRLGWKNLKLGQVLNAVKKSQGLRKGEKVEYIGKIIVTGIRAQQVFSFDQDQVDKEGFPLMTPEEFIAFFCLLNNCKPEQIVRCITFKKL